MHREIIAVNTIEIIFEETDQGWVFFFVSDFQGKSLLSNETGYFQSLEKAKEFFNNEYKKPPNLDKSSIANNDNT